MRNLLQLVTSEALWPREDSNEATIRHGETSSLIPKAVLRPGIAEQQLLSSRCKKPPSNETTGPTRSPATGSLTHGRNCSGDKPFDGNRIRTMRLCKHPMAACGVAATQIALTVCLHHTQDSAQLPVPHHSSLVYPSPQKGLGTLQGAWLERVSPTPQKPSSQLSSPWSFHLQPRHARHLSCRRVGRRDQHAWLPSWMFLLHRAWGGRSTAQ